MPRDSAIDPLPAIHVDLRIRTAKREELAAINAIVTRAVLAWPMAERLKRLALNVLRYDRLDFDHMQMLVADLDGCPAGMAAWDSQTAYHNQAGERGALLHGLYVLPQMQGAGIGSALQRRVAEAAAARGFDGLLVKAERVSVRYFDRCGYERLSAEGGFAVNYPYLFWCGFTQR